MHVNICFYGIRELTKNRSDTLGCPTKSVIFMQTIFPVWVLQVMSKFSRARNLVHARYTAKLANEVTRELVRSKAEALLQGKGSKDILTLLGKLTYYSAFPFQLNHIFCFKSRQIHLNMQAPG